MFIVATKENIPGIQLGRTVKNFTIFVPFYLKYILFLKLLYKLSSSRVYYFEDFIDTSKVV